jgi:uroporphyrin-III C-methyltransferase
MKSIINQKVLKYSIVSGDFNNIGHSNIEAYNTMRTADVIVFDEYIHREIVEQILSSNVLVYKAVLNGNYKERSKFLNELIVELARMHGHVVHIRGLNHKLFEESFESINYVKSFNIETSIINLNVFLPQELLN